MVVDSSIFLEVFSDGRLRTQCEARLKANTVAVPTLVIYEIYKELKFHVSEDDALMAVAHLRSYRVLDLTSEVALLAADLSLEHNLTMVESTVLAHARELCEPLLTLDQSFIDIPGTTVLSRT